MKFKKIRWKNFLSYGNKWTEFDLDENTFIIIQGTNGSGKSVICDALFFALLGRAYRNINKPQLVSTTNKKDCVVELELEHKTNEYKIIRGINPGIFEIHKNGKMLEQSSSIDEYQKIFEQALEISQNVIRQTIIMSSRYYKPFLELPMAQKREFVESILSIELFKSINDNLKKKYAVLKNEEIFIEKDIERIESNIKLLQKIHKKQKEDSEKEKREILQKISELEEYNLKQSNKLIEKQNAVIVLQEKIVKINDKTKYHSEILKRINEINYKIKNVKEKEKFFSDNNVCPFCTQDITDELKLLKINEFDKIFEQANLKLDELKLMFEKLQRYIDHVTNLNEDIGEINKDIFIINNEINNNNKEILKFKENMNKISIGTNYNIEDIDKFNEEKKESEKRKQTINKTKKYCDITFKLISEKGIKKFILQKYIPILNKYTNYYLDMLEAPYKIMFNDEIEEKIIARGYENLSYQSFSSGEKQRLDLALLFSFLELSALKNSLKTNLLILDEVLDQSLDSTGINGVFKIFYEFQRKGYTIIVISHREGIENFFNKVYKVTKKNFSEIEEIEGASNE